MVWGLISEGQGFGCPSCKAQMGRGVQIPMEIPLLRPHWQVSVVQKKRGTVGPQHLSWSSGLGWGLIPSRGNALC